MTTGGMDRPCGASVGLIGHRTDLAEFTSGDVAVDYRQRAE